MPLSKLEQEVLISFNASDDICILYSSYKPFINKMDKLCKNFPETFQVYEATYSKGNELYSKTYCFNKKYVSIRKPFNISEEQRQKCSERAKERFGNKSKSKTQTNSFELLDNKSQKD